MFKPLEAERADSRVTIRVDGHSTLVRANIPLAIALLEAGHQWTRRNPVSGQARAPYCLMGACQECLVQIDGMPNVLACKTMTRADLDVVLQESAPALGDSQ